MAQVRSKTNMRKTTIELTQEQYFFLKEKSLQLQKQNRRGSIVSIIRDLIDKDRKEWNRCRTIDTQRPTATDCSESNN